MAELYAEDVSITDGLDQHFRFEDYLEWLRARNPYGLHGLVSWIDASYEGVQAGYRGDHDVASIIFVNLPSRSNAGMETLRGPSWAMDIYGGAQRAKPYQHPIQRAIREARGIADVVPCSEYRPHADISGLNGEPFCLCGFERRQHGR